MWVIIIVYFFEGCNYINVVVLMLLLLWFCSRYFVWFSRSVRGVRLLYLVMFIVCFVFMIIFCLWMIVSWVVWWFMWFLFFVWCMFNLVCYSCLCLCQCLFLVLLYQLLLLLVCVVLLLGEVWLGRLSWGWVIWGLFLGIGFVVKFFRKYWRVVFVQWFFVVRLCYINF